MRDPVDGSAAPTALDGLLRSANVHRVVVAGLATDYCVKATALDAVRLGYDTTVLTDAIAAVDLEPGDGDRALDELAAAGVELTTRGRAVIGIVLRVVIRLGAIGLAVAWVADEWLRRQAGGREPAPFASLIVIDAPIERVWAVVSDIEGQPRWMHEMKDVRLEPAPVGVGTRGRGDRPHPRA